MWGRVKLMGDKEVEGSGDKEDVGKQLVSEWKCVGEGSREIAPTQATPPHTLSPARPQPVCCSSNPFSFYPPFNTPSTPPPLPPPFPVCVSPSFFQVCCTRGGKDRIYHLSAFGSPELRDAGQHKIIIHRHEITKPPGDPTTKLFHFSTPKKKKKKKEGVWLWGEGVTGEKWGW